jgi:16S rRNA (guanine966-N2)-methyltransferase
VRIISGKFRGRKLADSSFLKDLRPTADRNREALFNILTAGNFLNKINFNLIDSNVLDLCCGTGSVGFESLSRGAKSLTLIDNNSEHLLIAKKNAEILGIVNDCNFIKANAKNLPIANDKFDLIFVDPPYQENYSLIINELIEKKYLSPNTLLVVECSKANKIKNQNLKNKNISVDNLRKQDVLNEFNPENITHLNSKILDYRSYGNTGFYFIVININKFETF